LTDNQARLDERLKRFDEVIESIHRDKSGHLSKQQAAQVVELLEALGPSGTRIIADLVYRHRQSLAVQEWFSRRRSRAGQLSGWALAGLTTLWAIQDQVFTYIDAFVAWWTQK